MAEYKDDLDGIPFVLRYKVKDITYEEAFIEKEQKIEDLKKLRESLDKLPYREREILLMRYGIKPYKNAYTLEEVGKVFKISRQRVKQIEKTAMDTISKM